MKFKLLFPVIIAAMCVTFGMLGIPSTASATFIVTLDDMATPGIEVTVTDSLGTGEITYTGSVGGFSVFMVAARSKPAIGSVSSPAIELSGIGISSLTAGAIQIKVTDTDFLMPSQELGLSLANNWWGSTPGIINAQAFLGINNIEFEQTFSTPLQSPADPDAAAQIPAGALAAGASFSLTEVVTVTHTAPLQSTNFGKNLSASSTPEPSTVVLLGFGILGLLGVGWQRKKLAK